MVDRTLARLSMYCLSSILCCTTVATAAIKLPSVIGDNMVLQRDMPVPIWGWAEKGETITVIVSGSHAAVTQRHVTRAGDDGRWQVVLSKLEGGQPVEITINGSSGAVVPLKNVLVGEVWVCSGQSNMEMGITMCKGANEEIAAAHYPHIRLFMAGNAREYEPAADVAGAWAVCTPRNITKGGWGGFSAVAYFFGRQLHKELHVPVGLIDADYGGTPIEFWTSRKALEAKPGLRFLTQGVAMWETSCLYNGMIAPLAPYAIRGAVWYQGETNILRPDYYRALLPVMIADWRAAWGQGDFPFGLVQLPPYRYELDWGVPSANCVEIRDAQLMTLKTTPNTGMVVTMDIGDVNDLHPKNKQDVARRLALWALAKAYGRKVVYSGPIYKSMAVEGNKLRLQFEHVGEGLAASDGKPLTDFIIAGADHKFLPAVAEINGNSIVVHSDQIAQPVAVRYAWRDNATPNLVNKDGLPASPFRTDALKEATK